MAEFRYSQNFTRNSGISIFIQNSVPNLVRRQQSQFIRVKIYFSVEWEYYSSTKLHNIASYSRKFSDILRNFRRNSGIGPIPLFQYLPKTRKITEFFRYSCSGIWTYNCILKERNLTLARRTAGSLVLSSIAAASYSGASFFPRLLILSKKST